MTDILSFAIDTCYRITSEMGVDGFGPWSCHCANNNTINTYDIGLLRDFCDLIHESEAREDRHSKPMLWIGNYIAVASLFCILAMAADLFHGFRNRKLWFPSKYFTLNAASITIIAIAMKLPVDLSGWMPGSLDKFTKMGSMVFMCTMMANLMPSLASMGSMELFANVAGMTILVITIVVNVFIEAETGVVYKYTFDVYAYIGAMLYLLMIMISSALTIPTSKRILELKYQVVHTTTFNDTVHPQHTRMSTVEELTQHVRKYWIMAGTCSPQFVMTTTPLCSAAGITCVITTLVYYYFIIYDLIVFHHVAYDYSDFETALTYDSDYKWSMVVIFITQSIGIVVGTIAPVYRCFAALSFKLSIRWIKKHAKVCEVEKYWTRKLSEWKEIHLTFPLGGCISKALVYHLHNLILNLCIICQKVIVVSCKILGLIPLGIVIIGVFCVYCFMSLKAKFFAMPIASNGETTHFVENNDIGNYVLKLQDEMDLSTTTFKSISNSVNHLIQTAEMQLPNNLLKLIEQCTRFEGVVNFDSDDIQPGIWVKFPNSWSLPVVTLTCIAITLPNISKDIVDSLFRSVSEVLSYTLLVEESVNNIGGCKKIHKATKALWHEVEFNGRWLGNMLQRNDNEEKNPKEILIWFADKAEEIALEMNKHRNEELFDDSSDHRLIAADSMYRITHTIIHNHPDDIEHNREEQLFALLSGMIADIVGACLTNLPRVIAMKCHESAIEKREASVRAAATLLGSTKKIIEKLHMREVPSLDPDQMASIDEWRVHLKQSIP